MERREFIKIGCAACSFLSLAAIIEACSKTSVSTTAQGPSVNFTLDLTNSSNAALKNVGGSVYSNGVIVVRTSTSAYAAVASACTHQGCTVNYDKSSNDLVCPCHGGTYDMNGNVTGGPPPAPLKKYNITQNGNILTISG